MVGSCQCDTCLSQARQHIINLSAENAEFLEIIETSLFSLTFSDLCPETQEEVQKCLCFNRDFVDMVAIMIILQSALCALTGDARNQWFDKSLTQVCCDNGMFCDNLDVRIHQCPDDDYFTLVHYF